MTWVSGRLAALPEDSSQVAEPTCIPVPTCSLGRHYSSCGIQTTQMYKHMIGKKYAKIRSADITFAMICKTSNVTLFSSLFS